MWNSLSVKPPGFSLTPEENLQVTGEGAKEAPVNFEI
jgi:hypothetical protein